MSANYFKKHALAPGAELLENRLTRRTGIATKPTRGRELKQPPAAKKVASLKQSNHPAAGTHQDGTPIRTAGGTHLATVEAQKWPDFGFYTAQCPNCQSTIEVVKPAPDLNSLNTCRSCGTPFFAETAAA